MFENDKGKPSCPLLRGPCIEARCKFWVRLLGNNPQSGKTIDEFDCAVSWLPVLLIEGTQQTRQAGAAIESMRNEQTLALAAVVRTTQTLNGLIAEAQRLAGLPPASRLEKEIAG